MSELNKLFTSLILLGGGFFAASLVGPPEVIDRLSRYLQPSGFDSSDGLRPLADATPAATEAWSTPAPSVPGGANQMASVAAMMPSGSWPGDAPTPNVGPASPWASTEPTTLDAAAPSQDWLTSQSLASPALQGPVTPAPGRELAPVPRGEATDFAAVASVAATPATPIGVGSSEADGWPELRAPLPPMEQAEAQPGFPPTAAQEVNVAKPVIGAPSFDAPTLNTQAFDAPPLDANPYASRPQFDAASAGVDADRNPLRYDASTGQTFDPIDRQPTAASETFVQHIVTDGDTLPSIAQRYLGDAGRAQELFEMNRDRLQHPDVLPIGMVLKAPKNRVAAQATPSAVSATGVGYPHLERPGDFSTVSASEAYLPPVATAQRRPLTAVGATADRPLTDDERLGPIDAVYQQEFAWDANGW